MAALKSEIAAGLAELDEQIGRLARLQRLAEECGFREIARLLRGDVAHARAARAEIVRANLMHPGKC